MSWQRGQPQVESVPLLAAMQAAAGAGSMKPLWEQGLAAAQEALRQVPGDVDVLAFQQGVLRWQQAVRVPYGRDYAELAAVGRVRLLDAGGAGPVVVLVPSMINRGYVLDLCEGHSVVAGLRQAGLRVLVVDWGVPDEAVPLGLDEVVAGHLVPLLERAAAVNGGPVGVFGYCMGGTLSVAAAQLAGTAVVGKLAVGAAPWDFSVTASATHMAQMAPVLAPWLAGGGVVQPAVMAQYFWSLDPWSGVRRLMALGREQDPVRLAHMVALEDWLHDGLPLDGPVARQMLEQWYGANQPLRGEWHVAGEVVVPARLEVPLWVAVPQRDVLVPPASALALVGQTPAATVVTVPSGHVGLVCGRRALETLVTPLAGWLRS